MKRLNYKRLAAVCLSICLAASQSMISAPVYAGQTAEGDVAWDEAGGTRVVSGVDGASGAGAVSGVNEASGARVGSDTDEANGMAEAGSGVDEANGGVAAGSGMDGANGAAAAAAGTDKSGADILPPPLHLATDSSGHAESSDKGAADDSESQELPDDDEMDGDLLLEETAAAQITGWQWVDPAHHLADGVLALPDVNPDNQASFDTVVSQLSEKILATVAGTATESDADIATGSNAKAGRQKELTLDGWSCDTFQTDRDGNWPTTGEYTFEAQLAYGGGYELSEAAPPLEVTVILGGGNLLRGQSSTGDFIVTGGAEGTDYSYGDHTLTILTDAPLEISSGEAITSDKIAVAPGVQADITLAGVNIKPNDTGSHKDSPLNMDRAGESRLTLKDGTVNVLDGSGIYDFAPGIYVPNEKQLTITGTGTLTAKGGRAWPGIGRNEKGKILIEGGNIEAVGGVEAAGIGGSSWCNGGTITITGGTVTATGGSSGSDIGNGYHSGGSVITISGGTVTAAGDHGIGDGDSGWGSTFSTGSSGYAVITAKNISDKSKQDEWSCVIFEGDKGQVYGNPTMLLDFSIPAGKRLIIGSNQTLTVNGTLTNYGDLAIRGTLKGSGLLDNQGTATLTTDANISLRHTGNPVKTSDTGNFTVEGGTKDIDYSYDGNILTILKGTPLEISSLMTADTIAVAADVQADLTLAGVNIKTNGQNCPLSLKSAGESRITLKEGTVNILDGSATTDFGPGIYVPNGKLTITGGGALTAKGGRAWPGIGRNNGGNLLIEDGAIEAVGGRNAAGIGGSSGCNGGSITITGGDIKATGTNGGDRDSADIGSGGGSHGSSITISGGVVTTSGTQGIGNNDNFSTGMDGHAVIITKNISNKSKQNEWSGVIFEGDKGQVYGNPTIIDDFNIPADKKLTISFGHTLTVNGTLTNYGILSIPGTLTGSGKLDNQGTAIQSPVATISLEHTGNAIETSGTGDFTVTGGTNGTDYFYDAPTLTILTATPLEIGGSTTAGNLEVAAGVSADITLAGVSITTNGKNSPLKMDKAGESVITLKEGTVNTLDGSAAEDLGPGICVPKERLTITGRGTLVAKGGASWPGIGRDSDGNILIESGTIEAVGGSNAAGIGGSSWCNGGTITITGGKVTAAGGSQGSDIGNGYNAGGSVITISGGTVTTTGEHGIGDGVYGKGSTFSTGSSGNAVIVTKSITDKSKQGEWSGIIFEDAKGQVYGNPTITAGFDITEGEKLSIGIGHTLTVNAPAVVTNHGTLAIYGSLAGSGTLDNQGTAIQSPAAQISLNHTGNAMETSGTGDFTVTGGTNGTDYLYDDPTLTILTATPLEISGTTTSDSIVVAANVSAHLTLAGVSITTHEKKSPLNMDQAEESVITLKDGTVNTLDGSQAGNYGPGIYVPNGKQLTITGMGQLVSKGSDYWPGIGRNGEGKILIKSGTIIAQGGSQGAGIGGSSHQNGGAITITGGRVTATGGSWGSDIGDGYSAGGSTVTISGGTVTATGHGIGGSFSTGNNGSAFIIASTISDKENQASWKGVIFEGSYGKVYGPQTLTADVEIPADKTLIIDEGETLTLGNDMRLTNKGCLFMNGNGTLNGEGSIVNESSIYKSARATLPDHLTGDGKLVPALDNIPYDTGDGSQGKQDNVLPIQSDLTVWPSGWFVVNDSVNIPDRILALGDVHLILADGGTLTARAGIHVPEGSSFTIYGQAQGTGKLDATGNSNAGIGGNREERNAGSITIKGGTVNALSHEYNGNGGAGIGGGSRGMGGTIVISGGTVIAQGGSGGAGIGAGYKANNTQGSITISGGRVTATSTYSADGSGGGAGIGGGGCGRSDRDGNGNITISGGIVTAYGSSDNGAGRGSGIGAGFNGYDASFSTGDHGNAIIFTSDISGNPQGNHPNWDGVIFQDRTGLVYGTSITPTEDIEIPEGKTLTIGSEQILIIDIGRTLVNRGTIQNNGTLIIKGALENYGEFTGNDPVNQGGTIKWSTKLDVSFTEGEAPVTEAVFGKTITVTADITPSRGNADTGTVDFYLGDIDKGQKLGGDVSVQDGKASLVVILTGETWKPAQYTVTAAYHVPSSSGLLDCSGFKELRVKKITQETPNKPEIKEATDTSITLKTVSGQRYCYSRSSWDKPAIDDEAWKTASGSTLVFSGLDQNDDYYVWTYLPGDDYEEDSPVSKYEKITTLKSDDQKAVDAAIAALESYTAYYVDQAKTEGEDAVEQSASALLEQMHILPGVVSSNVSIQANDIEFSGGVPAVAGTEENPNGQNGSLEFYVSLQKGTENTEGYGETNYLTAVIKATPYIDPKVQEVKQAIESGTYRIRQEDANTSAAVANRLASQINALPAMAGSDIVVDDLAIDVQDFTEAISGDMDDRGGRDGSFTFTVALNRGAVHDVAAGMGSIIATPYQAPPVIIRTESLPKGKVGAAYTAALEATGDPTIHWSIISGSLPEGLTLSGAVISGIPRAVGSCSFTVRADNGNDPAADKEFTITVSAADGGGSDIPGSDPDSGSDHDSDSSSTAAAPQKPQPPATGESSVNGQVDQGGSGTANIPDGNITSAIQEARGQSGKGGISLTVNVALNRTPTTLTVTLSRAALDAMIAANVEELKIENPLLSYSLNLDALKTIQTSVADSLAITATRLDAKSLSPAAQAMIGGRPAFDLALASGGKAITGLGNGSACLWIPYTPGADETAAYVEAVYADNNGGAQWLPGSSYDTAARALKLTTRHLSVYGVGYRTDAPRFADIADSWAKADIEFAAARGLLAGTGETTFSPDSAITGEAFAAALGRLSGNGAGQLSGSGTGQPSSSGTGQPSGSGAGQPSEPGLAQYLGGTGISLSPSGPISREQMAVIMMNFINSMGAPLPKARESITFVDSAHISGWAKEAVTAMQMAGVMGAKDGNRFDPQGTVTRAEAAAFLHRFVKLSMDPSAAQGWTQNDSGRWLYYEKGTPVTGWKRLDGQWYWLDASGYMQSGGWKSIGVKWYYFYPDGSMAADTVIDGYEIGPDGARKNA